MTRIVCTHTTPYPTHSPMEWNNRCHNVPHRKRHSPKFNSWTKWVQEDGSHSGQEIQNATYRTTSDLKQVHYFTSTKGALYVIDTALHPCRLEAVQQVLAEQTAYFPEEHTGEIIAQVRGQGPGAAGLTSSLGSAKGEAGVHHNRRWGNIRESHQPKCMDRVAVFRPSTSPRHRYLFWAKSHRPTFWLCLKQIICCIYQTPIY